MIKNIFLPDQIKQYRLFSKRIIGFDIGKTHISASQIYLTGDKTIIEKCIDEKIELTTANQQAKQTSQAIQRILERVDQYDAIYSSLSSALIIFKELKLPFFSHEKIKKVLPFEIEPLLPFALTDATIDFIITKKHLEEKSAELLVAAVQNQHIAHHIKLFEDAGVSPEVITVDLFALYGLYNKIPDYSKLTGGVALIDLGKSSTRIAYLQNGQLRLIRTLTKGMLHIAKATGEILNASPSDIMENSLRFGLEKPDDPTYVDALTKTLSAFWKEIQFTLNSFTMQTKPQQEAVNTILLLGGGAEIKGIETFATNLLQIQTKKFQVTKLLNNHTVHLKNKMHIPSSMIVSLSTALPSPETEEFNLRKDQFSLSNTALFNKQFIVGVSLFLLLFGLLGSHVFWQKRKLTDELTTSKKEAIAALQEKFTDIEAGDLDDIIENAQEKLAEDEKLYAKTPFLKYLLELTNKIDAKNLGFTIDKLSIAEDKMILDAQVKDYEALKLLESDLKKSKLFSYVEPQENTKFSMELLLAKEKEE